MGILDEPLVLSPEGLARLGVGYSNMHRLRLEARGAFPKRLSLGSRRVCYLTSEIKAWIVQRAADRDATAAARSEQARRGVQTRSSRKKAIPDAAGNAT